MHSNITELISYCLARDLAGVKLAWVVSSGYKHFFYTVQPGFKKDFSWMVLHCGKDRIRLDREKVLEFIRKYRPFKPENGYLSMSFSNLSYILKNGWTARNVKDNHYRFFSPEELQEHEYDRALGEFYNETNREWVDYVGDCIFHAKNPTPDDIQVPSASGTPLEFFAQLIVGGYSREKFMALIPRYLNAMEKSKSFGKIMTEILKRS